MVKNHGFTLMEILIAALLLTTVVVGLLQAFVTARGFQPPQFMRSVAVNLAREKLETLYEAVRQDFNSDNTKPLTVGAHVDPAPIGVGGVNYLRQYTVSSVDVDGGGEDYRKVEVSVSW